MTDRIIDCCSLLNLFAGWGGLESLGYLPHTWHICEAGFSESEFTREYAQGGIIDVPLDLRSLSESGLLRVVRPESEVELADYVEFAAEVDDGEAQALAVAKHRKFVLLTDDRKATKLASRPNVNGPTITTVAILKEWVERAGVDKASIGEVIKRIEVLARFGPRKGSADWDWWKAQVD